MNEAELTIGALRLLLGELRCDPDDLDWAALRPLAESGGAVVRIADAIAGRGEAVPERFAAAAASACARTQHVLELVDRLGDACTRAGIAHAFLKVVERYPDSGRDLHLLIADPSPAVDRTLLQAVPAAPRTRQLRERLVGTTTYAAAYGMTIGIRHGRLGRLGEHARYARILLGRARPVAVGPTTCAVPAPEDHLLLLATHQTYTWPAVRLGDLVWAIGALRAGGVNWDYVFATALSMGTLAAVGCYLGYLDRLHRQVAGRALLADDLLTRFSAAARDARTPMARFPWPRAAAALYLRQVRATLESRRWHSAARLSLLPVIAALAAASGTERARRSA
jgi:hypothetical protein